MSTLRWHRVSLLWKSWMFNQDPAAAAGGEPGLSAEPADPEPDPTYPGPPGRLEQNGSGPTHHGPERHPDMHAGEPVARKSCLRQPSAAADFGTGGSQVAGGSQERAPCVLQVDNGSEGDEGALHRDSSQRTSRRRFRRVNPRGERELITDGQEPAPCYNTVSLQLPMT